MLESSLILLSYCSAAAGAATKGGAASLQNAPFATPKHHATEGRNDLQINRKSKFPGGRNVPSASLQNAPFATPKHHATEGRNDLQINRKSNPLLSWRPEPTRNLIQSILSDPIPSEILLEILSYPILLSC